jgi:short-subunit dehydrogenase involved in D-alanine esterification of teichoic acids
MDQSMSGRQEPLDTGYETTAAEVISGVSLEGKMAIVTGGYSGIGLEMTRTLLDAGARVIVPARDRQKAAEVLAAMPEVVVEPLDLMEPVSIDAFKRLGWRSRYPSPCGRGP